MSADMLRRAAALMRERATDATEGRWSNEHVCGDAVPNSHIVDRWFVMGHFESGSPTGPVSTSEYQPDADHIASWHPDVALAVADWLDVTASTLVTYRAGYAEALTVARAYLGEQP